MISLKFSPLVNPPTNGIEHDRIHSVSHPNLGQKHGAIHTISPYKGLIQLSNILHLFFKACIVIYLLSF